MQKTVGIPRALLYYEYFPLWKTFFEELGAKVVVSPPTTKHILNSGVKSAVDEACLPVKTFYGHVLALKDSQLDYIFIPRMVSVERRAYTCPKFLGLPDMIRNNIPGLPPIIDVTVNLSKQPKKLREAVFQTGHLFTRNPFRIWIAYRRAVSVWNRFRNFLFEGYNFNEAVAAAEHRGPVSRTKKYGSLTVAVLGHPYILHDHFISSGLLKRLEELEVTVLTTEMVPEEAINWESEQLPKPLFWTYEKKVLGSALHILRQGGVDGMIHVVSFACGPDSMVGELIEREARRKGNLPFMLLTLDEQTGEAGLVTRLEAFVDMIQRRRFLYESHVPAHG